MAESLPVKLISETITVTFEFLPQLEWLETLSDPAVTVEVFSGIDAVPSDILSGAASISGSIASQNIQAGQGGVIYLLIATATGSSGNNYQVIRTLAIITDDNSFQPGRDLVLAGTLPNGTVGVAYSHSLQISGGYQPYEFDDIVAGISPPWMSFNVVGETLVCAGMPDEFITTNYSFTPQVRDGPNNLASAPQSMQIVHMQIYGDISDGFMGELVSGTYTEVGGIPAVTYAVTAGTFPPGITLATDGTYSGSYTTAGSYSWEITGTDSVGTTSTITDNNAVAMIEWWSVNSYTPTVSLQNKLYVSLDLASWTTTDRSPNIVPGYIPPCSINTDNAIIFGTGTTLETISNFSKPVPTVIGSGAFSDPVDIQSFDDGDILVLLENGIDTVVVKVSTNKGLTFTDYSTPSGQPICAITRLNSGRWIACDVPSATNPRFWYTDNTLPSGGWQAGPSSVSNFSATGQFVTNGDAAVLLTNSNTGYRTTGGAIYDSTITYPGVGSSVQGSQIAIGNIFLKSIGNSGKLKRSTNAGLTWSEVSLPVAIFPTTMFNALGTVVLNSVEGTVLFSSDAGLTWNILSSHPGNNVGFVKYFL